MHNYDLNGGSLQQLLFMMTTVYEVMKKATMVNHVYDELYQQLIEVGINPTIYLYLLRIISI